MVIELENVSKSYRSRRGRTPAVDALSLAIPRGGVHGFLGPNGSGKTTTIRMLLGLVAADAGTVRVLGAQVPHELPRVVGSVGALVESPQLFPSFTGRRNLAILATLAGLPDSRVDGLLELVGLTERADDRVKGYSLGMRQRLAIAAAMLKAPQLLILDEPTNGLDPAGMVEVRELVRRLGSDGRTTVFLSSHLLAEVEAVCDAVTILRRGALVTSGTVAEVLARAGSGAALSVRVPEPGRALEVLRAAGITAQAPTSAAAPSAVVPGAPAPPGAMAAHAATTGPPAPTSGPLTVTGAEGAHVNWVLATAGLWASEITPVRPDLERAFLDLTETPGESS